MTTYKAELFNNLQTAIELEHSTIPPYLATLFTINQDTNAFAYGVIRSVVMEEMLHMTLACNILNAVGGTPLIDNPKFIPEYPAEFNFADRKFDVGIIKFSKPAIEAFLEIEKPSQEQLNVTGEHINSFLHPIDINSKTIGEFYDTIKKQLVYLVKEYGEEAIFDGEKNLQITPKEYTSNSGEVIVVENLKTALFAIDVIVDQGEGISDSIYDGDNTYFGQDKEVAHYYRFYEVYVEQQYREGDHPTKKPTGKKISINWNAAIDMIANPKASDFPANSMARTKADEFNQLYSHFLQLLHLTFNGQSSLLDKAIAMMYQMKQLAAELLSCNIPGNEEGKVAGPPFEYIPLAERKQFDWLAKELTSK
ncbi:ferritin-like protein [Aquimarina sp. 2201CG1-2-11]|uniref:ferritin-like domain-containing protein n=1 Tax=Aquimarina discodermiae TaxID=3231043 RepID=UPI0034623220